jgi:hypothetical protein
MTFHEVIELFNNNKPQLDSTTNSEHTRVEKVDLEEDAMEFSSTLALLPNVGMSKSWILDYL